MINREELVRRYSPRLTGIEYGCPMTTGNGSFAFTADVTGLQTFYEDYEKVCPLLTMSEKLWHTSKKSWGGSFDMPELRFTEYDYRGRKVTYPTEKTDENGELYDWLRENPHRANLFRLRFATDGNPVDKKRLTRISQTLDMYTGILSSHFALDDDSVDVTTAVGNDSVLAIRVESRLCERGLGILLEFPYPDPGMSASDFNSPNAHVTETIPVSTGLVVKRTVDDLRYCCRICGNVSFRRVSDQTLLILPKNQESMTLTITVTDALDTARGVGGRAGGDGVRGRASEEASKEYTFKQVIDESRFRFYSFWNTGGMIDVSNSADPRADELERRIITSMYQCFVQDLGYMPPQETGLTVNSWYGKFHLEMHPIHSAFAALYGRGELLERSLGWYIKRIPKARINAARNGFGGARWPKMTGPEGIDSPSPIAPLLIWQQPNVIYMLDLLYRSRYGENRVEVPKESETEFLEKYRDLVLETAAFMEDFAVLNKATHKYELLPPLYSVQEKGDPLKIKNPPFELAYWRFGLKKAYEWMAKLGERRETWLEIAENMAEPYISGGKLAAYDGFDDTYTALCFDHPSMLFGYGLLNEEVDSEVLCRSLKAFFESWDMKSLWGWDFAIIAMTLARRGHMKKAFDVLLMDTEKNTYLDNGFNTQLSRSDLPLYMPGNGALLLAMTALSSCEGWYVETDRMAPYSV